MKLFNDVMEACIERFGNDTVQQIAEGQLVIASVNEEGEPMFPVYVCFHNETDLEINAMLFEVPEADEKAFMAQCNNLNCQYPVVKFYIDSHYLCAGMDLLLYTEDVADVMSMLTALLQVIVANLPGLLG